MCPRCDRGYCKACEQEVRGAVICGACDGLCRPSAEHERQLTVARQRARPLKDDLGTILGYPLHDPVGYVMLAVFTGFFSLFTWFGGIAVVLSQGVLMWYAFQALSRVAGGNLRDFTPDFRDIDDLVKPLRLGVAALVAASWPLLLIGAFTEGVPLLAGPPRLAVVHAQPEAAEREAIETEEGEEEDDGAGSSALAELGEASGGVKLLLLCALLWKLLYTPMALTVAGLSRSVLRTLNPLVGVDTIRRMGNVYWQALGIYCALAGVQWLVGWPLGLIPIAGTLVRGFVDAYAYLAIGCTLGLAVFKKAPELGWD
jgi:hypothetical protein